MNDQRLYINNELVDLLDTESEFTRTLQVNNLANLNTTQTNYSTNIKLPLTPNNQRIFGYLGNLGSQSQLPYIKSNCDYFVENDKMVHNGWAIINETNPKCYDITIYDGNLDIFKALENKTLGDLYIGEITHTKNLTSVINTWNNDLDYCYIIADYNGKSIISGDTLNIDYLIPSVKISYLWNRIFETYGFTYSGSIFQSEDFNNLWMTYPKGVNPEANDNIIPIASFSGGATNYYRGGLSRYILDTTGFTSSVATTIFTTLSTNGYGTTDEHIKALEAKNFNIKITGKINAVKVQNLSENVPVDIWFVKNCENNSPNGALASSRPKVKIAEGVTQYTNLNINYNFSLNENETFSILTTSPVGIDNLFNNSTNFTIQFGYYDDPLYDFQNELKNFNTIDFIKEIIHRYGLTLYKDKYTNNYEFRTLDEVINNPIVVNWSDKFQYVEKEKYLYGTYAQENNFKYKYNEENVNYNDGVLLVNNKNLSEKLDVIESKITSPEKDTVPLLELQDVHVYKMWNKEVTDTGQIKYKGLSGKYYFLRAIDYEFGSPAKIGTEAVVSGVTGSSTTVLSAKVETYQNIAWNETIDSYYAPLNSIFNNAKIITAKFYLTSTDIANFDFKKLYYIEQLGGTFLINKINNYKIGKVTSVELIKLNK